MSRLVSSSSAQGYEEEVMSRTVDSHIAELRRKLEDNPASPRHIVTVWTIG
jgi:two-component system alkaline phosphatase synthesis response regulator PhoP